jgi:hypothetical protein
MPAQLVDELDDSGQAPAALDLKPLEVQPSAQTPPAGAPVLTGDGVPDKYQGKSASDLLSIVQDQESHIGKQGQELGDLRGQVGTLRGLVDKSLELRDTGDIGRQAPLIEEEALTDNDFITQPQDAVSRTVKRETKDTNDRVARLEQQTAAIDFTRRHPTANVDVNDEQFIAFVKKSPVRTRLANEAFGHGEGNVDFDSADELWELYEEYQGMIAESTPVKDASETETDTTDVSASQEEEVTKEAPTMIKAGSSGDVGASTKPIYSQSRLNRLQVEDPDTYWASDTQAKISEARREGRVKDDT